jgi:hypothetical protein
LRFGQTNATPTEVVIFRGVSVHGFDETDNGSSDNESSGSHTFYDSIVVIV